jgi:UDP-N-acetylglucosamine 2-epimerase
MKFTHIVGARPQFIKMAAVSRAIAEHNEQAAQNVRIEELIVHSRRCDVRFGAL